MLSVTTTTSAHIDSSPEEDEVLRRRIGTRVGRENTREPPSSWETTAGPLQMFLTDETMDIFTVSRGHDRLSLIYPPFTIEEEVTFSEEEDVSAEKGRREEGGRGVVFFFMCAWSEPPVLLLLTDTSGAPNVRCDGGWRWKASHHTWSGVSEVSAGA